MTASAITLHDLTAEVVAFRDERDWRRYHQPKNLAMAVVTEAAELAELYLWQSSDESTSAATRDRSADEMADVLIYLISMADVLEIDLALAVREKLMKNAQRYPVEAVRGSVRQSEQRRLDRDE